MPNRSAELRSVDMLDETPKRRMIWGSIWAIAVRWCIRLSGFLSTMIVARLLTPADYGIVAIAAITAGFVELFSQTGQDAVIVRHPNPTREHFDSAWTVQLLLGFLLAVGICATIPLTWAYFNEPRAGAVVAVFALRTAILGAMNTGALHFKRDFQFVEQFLLTAYPTAIAFVVTIIAAFILQNYWALVIGIVTRNTASVIFSFVMHPFRPRIDFSKVREIWSFSIWGLARAIGETINLQVDKVAIGGFAGSASMGFYDVARDLATSPATELITPMTTVLMPVLAKEQHDKQKMREIYMNVLYWFALICTSTGVGVALVAEDMADLILGPKWIGVHALMPWFALSWCALGLSLSVYTTFETIGQPMVSARLQWIRVALLAAAVAPIAYFTRSVEAVAISTFVVTLALTPTLFYALARALEIPLWDFVVTLWRPIVASLLMAVGVLSLNAALNVTGPERLALDVAVGAGLYAGAAMILWHLVGRPQGPEFDAHYALSRLRRQAIVLLRTKSAP